MHNMDLVFGRIRINLNLSVFLFTDDRMVFVKNIATNVDFFSFMMNNNNSSYFLVLKKKLR